ncbi:hypothetical protein DFP73DRAFT_594928 [Morchella snyderi]|nr:hypothetical protein DFP73DRAFT_594928 [Morchella snyderi]
MKAIQLSSYGPSDLTVTTLPDPVPAADEYLIAIRAAATNFFDLLQIRGKYQHQPPFPWIAGSEFAGTVVHAPSATAKFPVGTAVFGAAQGAYATHITAREDTLHAVPAGWRPADAAGLYVTAPTAYAALVLRARLAAGETVLVHAGAGGVGLAAVQIAKALGAGMVIATAGTEEKLEVCRRFGADHGVVYSGAAGGWTAAVLALTGGRGVDVVFDPVGMVEASLKCVAWGARVVVVGFAGGVIERVATNRVLLKNVSVVGIHWGLYAQKEREERTVEKVWSGLLELVRAGKFRPTVYEREFVGLESVGAALRALGGRETWGKVVVTVPEEKGGRL